jgi:hypothetical protein
LENQGEKEGMKVKLWGMFRRRKKHKKEQHNQRPVSTLKVSSSTPTLKELCGDDDSMYLAMEHFLLLEPKRQLPLIGDIATLVSKAERASKDGYIDKARINLETAARISIYNQDEENTRRLLLLADRISDREFEHNLHGALLRNLNKALEIARKYYHQESLLGAKSEDSASKYQLALQHQHRGRN